MIDNEQLKKVISNSQHCQRNWDLTKTIPQEDVDLIVHALTQCPSKQNIAYYKIHVITDRKIIEDIHDNTSGFINYKTGVSETNSQTLANLLIVFENEDIIERHKTDTVFRNDELYNEDHGGMSAEQKQVLSRDTTMSIGIASGYANFVARMLGYQTGYCACYDGDQVKEILNTENDISLLLGIGYADSTLDRKIHPKTGYIFPSKSKQEITINYIK